MDVIVIEQHVSEYPDPIVLRKGEVVELGDGDDEYPHWIFVTTESGSQGWAPEQFIEPQPCSQKGKLLDDYDALELNTVLGEQLTVLFELNDWYRVRRPTSEIGWVPVSTVEPLV
ncbi:SH3 domain-containing protein [Enterovibrio coralii]|uniref:SH3 domain-containing protein n=1 Tax=Enterovibrio coralii TaxID=294935 RepID=A0A135IA18_9GAMM|nr:SH3 domain-containing protein [Enterovibrio coralii]KXF82306.1 hypothetical protein ATN88_09070 [Enterovibrio coralii]